MIITHRRDVINTHDQLVHSGGGVAITPTYSQGRDNYFVGWHIYRVNAAGARLATDKQAAWYGNGCKSFVAIERDRGKAALLRAQQWVAEQGLYSGPWVRNAQRSYVPAAVNKAHPIQRWRSPRT